MRTVRAGLHGLILVIADIAGIAGGAQAAFGILGVPNQVWLQLPLAVALSVGGFWTWLFSLRILRWSLLRPGGAGERGACLAASLLWAPLIFVPLHYLTQGYMTNIGNLIAMALYQLPVNAIALFGPSLDSQRSRGEAPEIPETPNVGMAFPLSIDDLRDLPGPKMWDDSIPPVPY